MSVQCIRDAGAEAATYTNECPPPIDPLLIQLHRWKILNEDTIGHRQETPDALICRGRGEEASVLQGLSVLVDQAVEDRGVLSLEAIGRAIEATSVRSEGKVRLSRDPVRVAVLLWEIWRGGMSLRMLLATAEHK